MTQNPNRRIVVEDYNPNWGKEFAILKERIVSAIGGLIIDVLHIGSTSIMGLAAKPIIDMVIVGSIANFGEIKTGLSKLGYYHNGDQGIKGREVFKLHEKVKKDYFPHHLYYTAPGTHVLKKYQGFLSYLTQHPDVVEEYSNIKKDAANLYPHDINKYMDFKGPFLAEVMTKVLNGNELYPDNPDKNCPKCRSNNINGKYLMRYLQDGYNTELFQNHCFGCQYNWEKNTNLP